MIDFAGVTDLPVRRRYATDPVYQAPDGKWWFYCEDWVRAEGPFETEILCREALVKYAASLEVGQ